MAVVEARRRVGADSALVWSIVADLEGDPAIPPDARRVEPLGGSGVGMRRRVIGNEGRTWEEECVEWVTGRRYTMQITAGDFPPTGGRVRYTCSLNDAGDSLLIRLYFDYEPRFGIIGRLLDRFGGRRRLEEWARTMLDNWVRLVHAREWAYRVTVRGVIEAKGGHVHSVLPSAPVREVVEILRTQRIGAVLVLTANERIAGVLSERDIVRKLAELDAAVLDEPARSLMTSDVITVGPEDNMMSVMACMSDRRIRHLPVVEGDEVLGLISIGDVIKARISELEGESETLLDYIEARRWHEAYKELGPAAYEEV